MKAYLGLPVPRHGARGREDQGRVGESAAQRPRRAGELHGGVQDACGPTCCSRQPRKDCDRSWSPAPARAKGKASSPRNLAIALSQAGQRVLLIDADMRRPRVHEIFGSESGTRAVERLDRKRQDHRRYPASRRRRSVAAQLRDIFRPIRPSFSDRDRFLDFMGRLKTTSIGRSSTRRRCWSSPTARSPPTTRRVSCSSSPRTRRTATPLAKRSSKSMPDRTPVSSGRCSIASISSGIRITTPRTAGRIREVLREQRELIGRVVPLRAARHVFLPRPTLTSQLV